MHTNIMEFELLSINEGFEQWRARILRDGDIVWEQVFHSPFARKDALLTTSIIFDGFIMEGFPNG